MNRKTLIFYTFICAISFLFCDKKQEYLMMSEHFTLLETISIDTSLVAEVTSCDKLRESFIILDKSSKAIHKLNLNTQQCEQIGRTGQGPGEYQWPSNIVVQDDSLIFFSDLQNPNLTMVNEWGEQLSQKQIPINLVRFTILNNDDYAILSNHANPPGVYVYNPNDGEHLLIKEVPEKYLYLNRKILGGGIIADGADNLIFAFAPENKIYKYNIKNGLTTEIFDLNSPFYIKADERLLFDNYKKIVLEERYKLIEKMSTLVNVYPLGGECFIVKYVNPSGEIFNEIWTFGGEFKGRFIIEDSEKIVGTYNDKIITAYHDFSNSQKFKIVLRIYKYK